MNNVFDAVKKQTKMMFLRYCFFPRLADVPPGRESLKLCTHVVNNKHKSDSHVTYSLFISLNVRP